MFDHGFGVGTFKTPPLSMHILNPRANSGGLFLFFRTPIRKPIDPIRFPIFEYLPPSFRIGSVRIAVGLHEMGLLSLYMSFLMFKVVGCFVQRFIGIVSRPPACSVTPNVKIVHTGFSAVQQVNQILSIVHCFPLTYDFVIMGRPYDVTTLFRFPSLSLTFGRRKTRLDSVDRIKLQPYHKGLNGIGFGAQCHGGT